MKIVSTGVPTPHKLYPSRIAPQGWLGNHKALQSCIDFIRPSVSIFQKYDIQNFKHTFRVLIYNATFTGPNGRQNYVVKLKRTKER